MKELLKNKTLIFLALLGLCGLLACKVAKVPEVRFYQFKLNSNYEFSNEALKIELENPLRCPVRIWIQPSDPQLKSYFNSINPLLLAPLSDTVLTYKTEAVEERTIDFAVRFGDIKEKIEINRVELPFPKDRSYPLVQGYNSSPTHNTDWSRYALDFGFLVGDTVCAATQGYVVGVIKDYQDGGADEKWRHFANVITIYDPETALFTQYVHLVHLGSLVEVGDRVVAGQKIGLAGMTGYTNVSHLHFNCLKPVHSEAGLKSIPIDSIGRYRPSKLKRGQLIKSN